MQRWLKAAGLVVLILTPVLVWVFWPSDAARIRKLVGSASAAAEARDIDALMSVVSLQYADEHGLSYLALKQILEREFKRFTRIKVDYSDLLVEVRGETASATMDIKITATVEGQEPRVILGGGESRAVLHLKLAKGTADRWTVKSALWPPAY